ncbi:MAG: hypothetical protein KDC44_10875 [Phaeodactylibacter sp.]|nr:hypothetical protein [Phaeodactylibacter sp.]
MARITYLPTLAIVLLFVGCQKEMETPLTTSTLPDDPTLQLIYNPTTQTLIPATEFLGLTPNDAKQSLKQDPTFLKQQLEAYTDAEEIYVDQFLDNGPEFTPITTHLVPEEYPTIQAAVDAAQPTDAVLINSGTYNEDVVISANNIRILGVGKHQLNGTITMAPEAFNVLVRGLTINYTGIQGYAIYNPVESMGNRFVQNTITTIGDGGENSNGIFVVAIDVHGDACVVRKNLILTGANGIRVEGGAIGHVVAGNQVDLYEVPLAGSSIAIQVDGDNNEVKINKIYSFADGIFSGLNADGNVIKKNTVTSCLVGITVWGNFNAVNENRCFENVVCDIINNGAATNTETANTANCIQGF